LPFTLYNPAQQVIALSLVYNRLRTTYMIHDVLVEEALGAILWKQWYHVYRTHLVYHHSR